MVQTYAIQRSRRPYDKNLTMEAELDSEVALWRLRALQALCADEDEDEDGPGSRPSALLFVCGVDGKDNWGSSAVLRRAHTA